jgi:beta-lactamase class A
MIDRRAFVASSAAMLASGYVPLDQSTGGRIAAELRILEAASGGTLGVAFVDTGSGRIATHNGDAVFPHCSSFKLSLAAMLLAQDEAEITDADEQMRWSREDLMSVSPFTTRRVDEGASLRELAEATQKTSDNAAANILLERLGGPQALTAFWRAMGDMVSRLDRTEPELNNVPPGEMRDTTSPRAMAQSLAKMLYGDVLLPETKSVLRQWMVDTQTGLNRVRKGLPASWRAGDKTGTSIWPYPDPRMGSVYVDIGFVEPSDSAPVTFGAYFRSKNTHDRMDPAALEVLAQVGRTLTRWVRTAS